MLRRFSNKGEAVAENAAAKAIAVQRSASKPFDKEPHLRPQDEPAFVHLF
jgi:hypothetical protein